jgi:hypothetical protein
MSDALPDDAEILGTLDGLIERLSKSKRSADLRNALLEAKRLKSATLKWGIIPPPPDARRELLERVTQLLTLAAGATPDEDPDKPPESVRAKASKKKGSSIHDEKTRPEGRFPSIHDEETAPLPSKPSAGERRRGKAPRSDGGGLGRSVHDEDTAPGPEVRAAQALEVKETAAAKVAAKAPIADEETSREGRPTKAVLTPPPPKMQRTQSGAVALASLQDLDLSDLELFAAPPSKSSLSASPQLPPIVMPALSDGGAMSKPKIEGFSSAVSSTRMPALRAPTSKPTEPLPAVKEAPGVTIVRASAPAWRPHPGAPGVVLRTVQSNALGMTALVKLPPSARLPSKKLAAEIELFVLVGSITLGPHELTAGDACRFEKDTTRHAITTTGACTLLYVGAEADV